MEVEVEGELPQVNLMREEGAELLLELGHTLLCLGTGSSNVVVTITRLGLLDGDTAGGNDLFSFSEK